MNEVLRLSLVDLKLRSSRCQLLGIKTPIGVGVPPIRNTVKCRLSLLRVADVESPNLTIRLISSSMRDVPSRKNKRKRIQKKWNKRYGTRQIPDYLCLDYKVIKSIADFQKDTIDFECELYSVTTINYTNQGE